MIIAEIRAVWYYGLLSPQKVFMSHDKTLTCSCEPKHRQYRHRWPSESTDHPCRKKLCFHWWTTEAYMTSTSATSPTLFFSARHTRPIWGNRGSNKHTEEVVHTIFLSHPIVLEQEGMAALQPMPCQVLDFETKSFLWQPWCISSVSFLYIKSGKIIQIQRVRDVGQYLKHLKVRSGKMCSRGLSQNQGTT